VIVGQKNDMCYIGTKEIHNLSTILPPEERKDPKNAAALMYVYLIVTLL
jgi:hypothetical protein